MSEIYDNSELGETYRGSVQDTAFPIYEENVANDEDPNDLESIYDQLTLFEKLKDNHWQVRRKAYCELFDFFESGKVPTNHGEDELKPETMIPWIQNMINEPNMIAMVDALKALNAFLTHHTCSRPQLSTFTGRLIDKLVLTKKNIQSNIAEILEKLLEGDDAHNIANEILKRLDNKNPKFLVQILNILRTYVKSHEGPDDAMTRHVFKSMLPLMSHSNKEARHLALEILRVLYSYIEEDFSELKGAGFGNLRHVQLKELEEALQNTPKTKERRLVKLTDGSLKAHEGALKKGAIAQKVDLLTLIPEKFLEVPYLVQSSGEYNQNEKKKKLEEFNQRIEQAVKTGCEIETHKDYSAIINLLIWMLEDKNMLINTEAVKSIDHLVRILKSNFPQSKLKYILTLIVEKLDAKKKTAYNTSLIQVLNDCITFNCMIPENLCELLLYNAESNKNMNVRTSCLNWFGSDFVTFLTAKRDILYANMSRIIDNQRMEKTSASTTAKGTKQPGGFANLDPEERIERLLAVVYKKIQQIHKKESNITLKKRCQQILDSLENLYARAEVISPPKEEPEKYNNLNDISSIKGNSRMINVSNLTLPHGEYDDNKENEYEEGMTIQHERTNRFEAPDTKRSEFAFENLKQWEKDQFAKLMAMFGDIRPQDDVAEKLEAIGGVVDKMNMEVLQACQKNIVQTIKRTLKSQANDYRNILRVFESANNLLIKMNKICLEIHSDTLKVELKIMLLFLANVLSGKSLEKTLDSMYMTCSIDKFLIVTLDLFDKVDSKYTRLIPEEKLANALRVYLNWLVVKVEKLQSVMFEEELLKGLERGFSQFRFSNLPQVHLGVSNVLGKKLKTVEDSAGNTSARSCQTPKINKHKKTVSVDTSNMKEESRMDDLSEIEQKQVSQKMNNIQEQAKSDVRGGLEKFSHLLSSLKKKSLDKLNMSHCMSPTPGSANAVSPNRHWKRGLGRDSTPKMSSGGRFVFGDSLKKPNALQGLPGKEDSDQKKQHTQIDVEDAIKFLSNICASLAEKEMAAFELSLFKLKSLYTPKDYLHLLSSLTPRLLAKECFNTRVPEGRIIKMLKNHLESLDKAAYLRTLKALFCMKARENDMETAKNTAKVGLDLTYTFYSQTRFPHKVIPIIVEMVVFSLAVADLRPHAEEILEMITKSVGRDGLRRIFEVELISSTKLYQIFMNWIDQQQSFGASPAQPKREASPVQQNKILEEENENTHTLIDDSFNNSITPQKQVLPIRRKSPTIDLRHSFDKALEDADDHQDLNQLSQILNTEENFDEPNFGTSFGTRRAPDTEQFKGLLDRVNRFETTEKRERHINEPDSAVPSFAQFKQNMRNDFGLSDLNATPDEKEIHKKPEPQQHTRMGRPVLGERNTEDMMPGMIGRGSNMGYQQQQKDDKENFRMSGTEPWFGGKGMGMKKEEREKTPEKWKPKEVTPFMPTREMVVGHQMDSNVQENKENIGVNAPQASWYGQGQGQAMMVKGEAKDGSAEKWKGKYIQEKERLQQTIELLEKANAGYLNHVTERTDLLGKLNNQRQMNEALYEKFNSLASENEKLKKDAQTFELEREKMGQQSLLLNSSLFQSKQDYKKFLNMKFITEALPIAAKGQTRNKEDFIKQFQEILLVSDNLELEVGESLMKIYEDLEEYGEKVQFVVNLKDSVTHPQVLGNLSSQNHKFLLEIALKLCVSENTQREIVLGDDGVTFIETDLTNEMQLLLDGLLRFHSMNSTVSNLLRIISDQMPTDFETEMGKSQKMLLKLGVKCLVKLSSNFKNLVTEDIRVFDVLVEIYKLFKLHPPENLKEGQPNLKDFEIIFRNVRTLADHIIDLNPNKAKEFSTFFTRENNKSIFLDYVKSYTTKYYPNLSSSMNLSHASFE